MHNKQGYIYASYYYPNGNLVAMEQETTTSESCRICLETIMVNEYICTNIHCTHRFHDHCIMTWNKIQYEMINMIRCPLCRTNWRSESKQRYQGQSLITAFFSKMDIVILVSRNVNCFGSNCVTILFKLKCSITQNVSFPSKVSKMQISIKYRKFATPKG